MRSLPSWGLRFNGGCIQGKKATVLVDDYRVIQVWSEWIRCGGAGFVWTRARCTHAALRALLWLDWPCSTAERGSYSPLQEACWPPQCSITCAEVSSLVKSSQIHEHRLELPRELLSLPRLPLSCVFSKSDYRRRPVWACLFVYVCLCVCMLWGR